MGRTHEIRLFRRRRHRAAVQRRGRAGASDGWTARAIFHAPTDDPALSADSSRMLQALAWKAAGYPWVSGCLYRTNGDGVEVRFVVPRPMARAMGWLARNWAEELLSRDTSQEWEIRVTPSPPAAGSRFRHLFWRPSHETTAGPPAGS